ncbi:MAG: type II secretion system ATPase GspE [Bradymonadia bacterium]
MNYITELGRALVDQGDISPDQLQQAMVEAQERGVQLTEALSDLKLVDGDVLARRQAEQLGLRYLEEINVDDVSMEYIDDMSATFAKSNLVLPLWKARGRKVYVGISDPLNMATLDAVRLMLDRPVIPVVVSEAVLLGTINKVYDRKAAAQNALDHIDDEEIGNDQLDEIDKLDIIDGDDEAPIIRLVNAILGQAARERASDIHIEPFERHIAVRFRVDGVLHEVMQPPKRLASAITARIKVMADLDIAERRIPQDGRIKIKVAGKEIDIRLSTLPTSWGERLVMRLLDKTAVLKDLAHIGMGPRQLAIIEEQLVKSYGIILVTGPTGSGKTTSLYASLAKINSPTRNIITVEDPVEYQLGGIGQIQVNTKVGLTFASGLRAILRQDPDVVMIGEIRDGETAEIAVQASLTGHLVFSTLHTNDAAGAVTRLVDMGVEPFLIASSVVCMMAQRLVRRLCPHCKAPVVPSETELRQLGYDRERFMAETSGHVYQPVGCDQCLDSGYQGRTGIYEVLPVDDDIRPLIMDNVDSGTIKKVAIRKGMLTLRDDGARKVMDGDTSIAEVLRVTQDDMLNLDD